MIRRPSLDLSEPAQTLDDSNSQTPAAMHDLSAMDNIQDNTPLTPPGEEMELVGADDDQPKVYPPPPRIAARLFYRPTNQARRKDSAASSRRNSISSAHSRSSHGCGRTGGPQSKYVAQHLRRVSILEDRKARLAGRAAHAEKVRLRAALAKAAARDISASEERALAAAQARERNLAEIAAACAEEVRRAKAIAESMKEKREQEMRRLKMQMEERLAEAERRREELRSRNAARARGRERGHSTGSRKPAAAEAMPAVKEHKERRRPVLTEEVAASRIQWHWRTRQRRKALAEFSALGLSLDAVRDTSFDQVTMMLSEENVLVATARMLRICGLKEGQPGSVEEMTAVRAFLSAYLILGHPSQVLTNKEDKGDTDGPSPSQGKPIPKDSLANPQSQELVGKARDLLVLFERILGRLTACNNYTPPPTLLEAFPPVYSTFYNALIAWKARDSSSLVDLMVMQFVELDAIWESVKNDTEGSVDQVYKESIRNNQILLLVRIKKLAGPEKGKQLVAEAVKAARKARAKKPRVANGNQSGTETAMGVLGVDGGGSRAPVIQTPTPPTSPSKNGEPIRVSIIVPPPNRLLPDNRVVVHELAINKEFRTEPHEYHRQQEHLLAPIFQEMRATMQTDDQDRHFFLLLKVAELMREKLLRMVTPGTKIHAMITELLDTDMARQQFAVGSFSYEKFFQAIGALLPKLCAPIRDAAAQALVEDKLSHGSYVDRLQALNGFIDVMVSDYANYLLHCAAPQLIAQGPAYEAKAFAADLEAGRHDLSVATRAWRAARQKVVAEAARRDPEGVNHPASRPTANRIYAQLLVDLFTQVAPVAREDVPEMLRLDYQRILDSGRTTRHIVTTAAILLQCKNLLKRDVRLPWRTEAQRILAVLERSDGVGAAAAANGNGADGGSDGQPPAAPLTIESATDVILAALETGRSMPMATRQHIRAMVTKFLNASAEAAAPPASSSPSSDGNSSNGGEVREPVLRLLLGRLRAHILGRLAAGSATEKARASSTAGERLAGLGLVEFVDRVREMVEMMGRVSAVDRDAHGPWWDRVAEEVEKEYAQGRDRGEGQGRVQG